MKPLDDCKKEAEELRKNKGMMDLRRVIADEKKEETAKISRMTVEEYMEYDEKTGKEADDKLRKMGMEIKGRKE